MPSLFNSRTGRAAQIYGSECGVHENERNECEVQWSDIMNSRNYSLIAKVMTEHTFDTET